MALVEPEESVGTILWVGASKSSKRAEIEEEGETRDGTWSLKDERGERLENKSWRASRDLADAASGKSHRSVTEEQEGGKETVDRLCTASASSTPLTLFFRVLFFFAETNRIDLVPLL